jgi:predicted GIY-YIG superfamily endonuclease
VEKKREYNIKVSVWARALTEDPERIGAIRRFSNVLIIDEVSMLTNDQKKKFFELYGDMKIIMCGDLGYQLPPWQGEECTHEGFDNIISHEKSFRCKCPVLREILDKLRFMIENKLDKTFINNYVVTKFKELGRTVTFDELKNRYQVSDMILCGTKKLCGNFTDEFKGKFSNEKFYITENNRLYSNGQIIIANDPPVMTKCEVKHAFTTHSIQGETAKENLYIESSKMFDSRMFYTAISRASYISQVYIVEPITRTFKYEFAKIYKLTCKSRTYIGSTIRSLEKRFQEHKAGYEDYLKGKGKYITSYKLFEYGNVKISLVEEYPCDDLKELQEREAEIISASICVNKTFKE